MNSSIGTSLILVCLTFSIVACHPEKKMALESTQSSETNYNRMVILDDLTVQEYVELLIASDIKVNENQVTSIRNQSDSNWISHNDITFLMNLIESKKEAPCIMLMYSSNLPNEGGATIGGHVMNIIDDYRHHRPYPSIPSDCPGENQERVNELKKWWAEQSSVKK